MDVAGIISGVQGFLFTSYNSVAVYVDAWFPRLTSVLDQFPVVGQFFVNISNVDLVWICVLALIFFKISLLSKFSDFVRFAVIVVVALIFLGVV